MSAVIQGTAASQPAADPLHGMVWIPAGSFRMGSDQHYPEEAPAHPVRLDGFWMDATPVTNAQFRDFVDATGHVTFCEIAPDASDYPDADPALLVAADVRARTTAQPLMLEHEMGELFKVIGFAAGEPFDAIGFCSGDRSHTL